MGGGHFAKNNDTVFPFFFFVLTSQLYIMHNSKTVATEDIKVVVTKKEFVSEVKRVSDTDSLSFAEPEQASMY